jgi:hypothetical protein
VHPEESLEATVNGVGAILYTGSPRQVTSSMNGLGTIGKKDGKRQRGWDRDRDRIWDRQRGWNDSDSRDDVKRDEVKEDEVNRDEAEADEAETL